MYPNASRSSRNPRARSQKLIQQNLPQILYAFFYVHAHLQISAWPRLSIIEVYIGKSQTPINTPKTLIFQTRTKRNSFLPQQTLSRGSCLVLGSHALRLLHGAFPAAVSVAMSLLSKSSLRKYHLFHEIKDRQS